MRKLISIAGVALIPAVSMPVFAQDSTAATNRGNDSDIIVTARRTEERLQDVPISITVVNQEVIAKRNITNAGDLGAFIPSLATNAAFGPEKTSFAIRGFNQEGRTAPTVAVYFADVVAPRANTGTTTGNGAGVGAFFDLQNVQVLKGPQGTLFGRNTTGGAILLVPTKPTDRFEGYVEGSAGNYNMHRVQAVINVPLSPTFRIRGAMDWNKADGYLRNRSGIGPDRLGNTNYIAARLSLVGDLTPDLENYTIFRYSKSDTYGNVAKITGAGTAQFPPTGFVASLLNPLAKMQIARAQARGDGFWDVDNSLPDPREYQRTWQVINTTTWRASDNLTVKNIISYADFVAKTRFNLFGDNFIYPANYFTPTIKAVIGLTINHPAGTFPVIDINTGPTGKYANQNTFTEELQFQGSSGDGRLKWQAGAYLEVSKPKDFTAGLTETFISCTNPLAYQCTNNPSLLLPSSISVANLKDTFNNKGLYAQATYKLSDSLSVTGGIRYTMDKWTNVARAIAITVPTPGNPVFKCSNIVVHPNTLASGPLGAECENTLQIKSNRPTWMIDLDYKPNEDLLLYAKYSRGYRQGTIIPGNLGLEKTGPEKVDTYEAGAKASFHGAMPGYFNIAAYYNNFRDQQLAANAVVKDEFLGVIGATAVQAIINAGKSRMWGIEVDTSISPFEGLKLDASYAYLNTKLIDLIAPTVPIYFKVVTPVAQKGGVLAQSPRNRVTFTATYTLPLDEKLGKIAIGATYTHTDANQAVSQNFAPTEYKLKAQDMLNLNVDWDSVGGMPVDLSFFMTNATNQKRVVYPITTFQFGGFEGGYVNLPRMWGFRLKYRFGE